MTSAIRSTKAGPKHYPWLSVRDAATFIGSKTVAESVEARTQFLMTAREFHTTCPNRRATTSGFAPAGKRIVGPKGDGGTISNGLIDGKQIISLKIGSATASGAGIDGMIGTVNGLVVPGAGTGKAALGAEGPHLKISQIKIDVLMKMGQGETLAVFLIVGAFTVASRRISPHFTI